MHFLFEFKRCKYFLRERFIFLCRGYGGHGKKFVVFEKNSDMSCFGSQDESLYSCITRNDIPLIDETLFLSRDIYKTYKSAAGPLKRHYLKFFYERFVIDNKVIVEAKPTPIFEALLHANMVRLRAIVLRTVNDVRTIIRQQNEYIYIPDLRAYANA